MSVNKAIIVGEVYDSPKLFEGKDGWRFVNLTVTTDHTFTKKDGTEAIHKDFHNVVVKGKLSDWVSKVQKGTIIYVEGSMRARSYEDKDGQKRTVHEIVAQSVRGV